MSTLGEKLKKLRKDKRWTIKEVAKNLDLKAYSTYSNWEYDLREPDLEMVTRIAELYDVDPNYLMPNFTDKKTKTFKEMVTSHDAYKNWGEGENFFLKLNELKTIMDNLTDEELLKNFRHVADDIDLTEEAAKNLISYMRFVTASSPK